MARVRGWNVPVGCLVNGHRGCVTVARLDAGGVAVGLVGLVGGCAGESRCEVDQALFVHGDADGNVGGCG